MPKVKKSKKTKRSDGPYKAKKKPKEPRPWGTGVIMTEKGLAQCVSGLMKHRGYKPIEEDIAAKICNSVRTKFQNKWPDHPKVVKYKAAHNKEVQVGKGRKSSVTIKLSRH
jgi:hypothetical protein